MSGHVKKVKGMQDFHGGEVSLRQHIFDSCRAVFAARNIPELDTPVAELKSVLTAKYGEEEKLIFDLSEQGGEPACLRYDLTIPFSRFVIENGLQCFRRFQIGKVYRRDQPSFSTGRYREFTQVDYDVIDGSAHVLPGFDVLETLCRCLDQAGLKEYCVVINDRRVLTSMLEDVGVPQTLHKASCSAIDKLDKAPWEDVSKELQSKGVSSDTVLKLKERANQTGPLEEMLDALPDGDIKTEYRSLAKLLSAVGLLQRFRYNASLARGLDYYRGLIFEVKALEGKVSLAAGGTYDALIAGGTESARLATGFSIGVERLCAHLSADVTTADIFHIAVCAIATPGAEEGQVPDVIVEGVKIVSEARKRGVRASLYTKGKVRHQLASASRANATYAIILGERELESKTVTWKEMATGQQYEVAMEMLAFMYDTNPQFAGSQNKH